MNFKSIGIIDDSIGGVGLLNKLKEKYNENFIYFADMKNFPYGLWKRDYRDFINDNMKFLNTLDLKMLIITNPLISLNINTELPKVDGIDLAVKSLKDSSLMVLGSSGVLESEIFSEISDLKKRDASMLINMPHDGDDNYFIINTLIDEYIEEYKGNVLLFDSNLNCLRKYFERKENIKVFSLIDFILEDFENKFNSEMSNTRFNKSKIKYFVSDYRIAFYLSCETFYEGRYSSVKKVNIDDFLV